MTDTDDDADSDDLDAFQTHITARRAALISLPTLSSSSAERREEFKLGHFLASPVGRKHKGNRDSDDSSAEVDRQGSSQGTVGGGQGIEQMNEYDGQAV